MARESAPTLSWKHALADAIRDPAELLAALDLPVDLLAGATRSARLFPLVVPREFVERMKRGDPADPLLRQVLPLDAEAVPVDGYTRDPLDERDATRARGLLQKYPGRALLIVTGACAVHCRYCFRRHFPYDSAPLGSSNWTSAIAAIREDRSLREVILSGGDPLVLDDDVLRDLVAELEAIPHLRRLRIHTRLPIVLPERVTEELREILRDTALASIVVVHANHASELRGPCAEALSRLASTRTPLFNQAVLLRGVNDDETALAELCERCVELGVIPYYLHQLDRVEGAAHFEVAEARGRELIAALRRRLPGYAVPRYVREVPGEAAKSPIESGEA